MISIIKKKPTHLKVRKFKACLINMTSKELLKYQNLFSEAVKGF